MSCVVDLKNVHLHWLSLAMNKLCYEGGKIHISLDQLNIDLIPFINILFAAEINNYFSLHMRWKNMFDVEHGAYWSTGAVARK